MPHAKGGIVPGLEQGQLGLVPQPTEQASVLEFQYPAFRDAVRKMRQAGMPEGLIAELLANAELTLKQKYSGRLSDQEITRDVIGRKPDIAQQFLATATRATGLGVLQDPQAAEAAEQAGGLPRFAGQVAGTLPLLFGAQNLISRIPALAARPIAAGAATGAAFGAGEPLLRGEEPTLGGTLGSAALFGAFGAFGRGARRPLPGTKPPPAEPAAPRVPGTGPFEPGGESPLFGRQEPLTRAPAGFPDTQQFIAGGESPVFGREAVAAGLFEAEQVVQRAPAWVQDSLSAALPRPVGQLLRMERQPAEALLKPHFASKAIPGYEDTLTLNMGFNPFALLSAGKEPIGKVLRGLLGEAGPEGAAIADALRAAPQTRMFSRLITGLHAFRGTAFLERLQPARFAAKDTVIRFSNLLDDIVKPISREDRNGPLIDALNSEAGYNAAQPLIRTAADRIRTEVLDPLFEQLKTTAGVRGREALRFLPFYYRHVLDRPETMKFIQKAARDFRGEGLNKQAAEMEELLRAFAVRGNAKLLMDEDASRLVGANMRDFFKDVPPGEAGFGAIEKRLANLPTFSRDFDMVMGSYIRGASRKLAFDPILPGLAEDIAVLGGPLRERAVRLMREFLGMRHPSAEAFDGMMRKVGLKLHDMFGVHPLAIAERFRAEDVSRMALQAQYLRLLYGNAGGALVNATQTPMNTFPLLAQKYGGREAASLTVRSMRLALSEEGRQLSREIIGRGGKTAALEGRPTLEALVGWGDLFGLVETGFNQRVAGLAEYLATTARGTEHGVAVKAAREFVDKTQFMLDPLRRPEILRGPLGQVLGQFQAFKLNQLDFFLNELDKTGKAYFIGMLAALGGPSAMPFIGPWLARQARPGGATEGLDVGAGLPGLTGLDIARRLNPLESTQRAFETGRPEEMLGRLAQSVLGPTPGAALSLLTAIKRFHDASPQAGAPTALWYAAEPLLREIEPIVATRAAQAAEIAATGQLRAGRPSGLAAGARALGLPVPPVRFGGASLGLQAAPGQAIPSPLLAGAGIPTQRQRDLDQLVQQQRQAQEAARAQRTNIATAYLHFKATGDAEPLREAIRAAPGVNVRSILLALEKPAERRLMQQTPRRFRGQFQEEVTP